MKDIIFDFIEENWVAFRRTCKDHGIPDDEVDDKFDKFKEDFNILDSHVKNHIQSIGRGIRKPNKTTCNNSDHEKLLDMINKILAQPSGRLDISDLCNYRISKMLCEKPSWCNDCVFDKVNTRRHNLMQFRGILQKSLDKG